MPATQATPTEATRAEIPPAARVLLTVRQLAAQQPALSEGGIRWDLFRREQNGLTQSDAVLRRGRRILIDAARYMAWMEAGREG